MKNIIIILIQIFPEQYTEVYDQMNTNAEFQSMVDDLIECQTTLNSADDQSTMSPVLREHYLGLFEELKQEVLLFLNTKLQ
jgi:hypothetical protein